MVSSQYLVSLTYLERVALAQKKVNELREELVRAAMVKLENHFGFQPDKNATDQKRTDALSAHIRVGAPDDDWQMELQQLYEMVFDEFLELPI